MWWRPGRILWALVVICSVAALVTGFAVWYSSGLNPHIIQGRAYVASGDLESAAAEYTEAIRLDPKNALIYTLRGSVYAAKGDVDRAIVDYTEAIRLDPKRADALNSRGAAYATKGDRESAVADFNESNDDYDHAIGDYDEAIRLKPRLAEAYYGRGHVYSQDYYRRDRTRAAANYDVAIQLNPKFVPWSWPEPPNDWNSLTVLLSRSRCFGRCPDYQVEIRGNGSVSYTGHMFVAVGGQQTSQIPQENVRALFRAFRRAAYLSLPDNASKIDVTDTSIIRTSIGYDGRVKSVQHNGTGPAALRELEKEIDYLAGTAKWVQ